MFLVTVTNGEPGGSENTSNKTLHIKQQQVDDDWGSDGMDAIFKQMKPKSTQQTVMRTLSATGRCHLQVSGQASYASACVFIPIIGIVIFSIGQLQKSAFVETNNHRRKEAGKPLLLRAIL